MSQPKSNEDWDVAVRDWWYSIQDLLAEKDICLHERKRVEIETIIKEALAQKDAESVHKDELQKAREDAALLGFQASGEGFNGEYCRRSDEYIKKYLKDKLNHSELDQPTIDLVSIENPTHTNSPNKTPKQE